MKSTLINYSTKTQEIAKVHSIFDKETLNLVEALLEKYPKLYEFLIFDKNIQRAIGSYLKKYHREGYQNFDNYMFFLEESEPTPRKLLASACQALGILIVAKCLSKITAKYPKESIAYRHDRTWKLDNEHQKLKKNMSLRHLHRSPRRK